MFNSDNPRSTLCRVLILGGGFGASTPRSSSILARRAGLEVTLVTRDNFFLFTPRLRGGGGA